MGNSTSKLSAEDKKRLAPGYEAGRNPVKNWDLDAAGADAIRSTVEDMLKFMSANLGLIDTLLEAAMARM
jgi:hypothetical protein